MKKSLLTLGIAMLTATTVFAGSHTTQIRADIGVALTQAGIEHTQEQLDALTDEQLTAVQALTSSGDGISENRAAIVAILKKDM